MATGIGAWILEKRSTRNLTLEQLARNAHVAVSTLSRWEHGAVRPCLRELNAVLDALSASPSERERVLLLIQAPRGVREERAAHDDDLWLPASGDLLRAMRFRNHLTAGWVASALGVTDGTVSHWERTRSTPSLDARERLCDLLRAESEERRALLSGWGFLGEPMLDAVGDLESLETRLLKLVGEVQADEVTLADLRFLTLHAGLTKAARLGAPARSLVAWAGTWYATWLSRVGRFGESGICATRALRLLEASTVAGTDWCRCVSLVALSRVHCGGGPVAGLRHLKYHLPFVEEHPEHATVFLREMADYACMADRNDEALSLVHRAYRAAQIADDPNATDLARHVHAGILVGTGRAQEAAALLPQSDDGHPLRHLMNVLRRTEVLIGVGDLNGAGSVLPEAFRLIERYGFRQFTPAAEALAAQL